MKMMANISAIIAVFAFASTSFLYAGENIAPIGATDMLKINSYSQLNFIYTEENKRQRKKIIITRIKNRIKALEMTLADLAKAGKLNEGEEVFVDSLRKSLPKIKNNINEIDNPKAPMQMLASLDKEIRSIQTIFEYINIAHDIPSDLFDFSSRRNVPQHYDFPTHVSRFIPLILSIKPFHRNIKNSN